MRQFQSVPDERNALHSTGDSSEMSPSWVSATSSALTPSDADHQLAFDFSSKCELVAEEATKAPSPTRFKGSSSMPTTPNPPEALPSPRLPSATGFFRFPFAANASPRRIRARTMSGDEPEDQITEERPPPSPTPMAVASSAQNEAALPTTEASAAAASKLRFPRFLRRTHSATYANARDVPPYALFLRTKRPVSKTRSADVSLVSTCDAIKRSTEALDGPDSGCKTRLSEMKLRLGFLRRRSTESSLTVRPQPQDAQKWALSFADLMASKYGAALYRAFLEREFSNENLEFWLACEEFKTMKAPKMAAKAQKIYSDFVAVQAPKEVNLDSETRGVTLNNLQANNLDNHVFDRAQRRIQNIMERDSYLRFLQSDLFLELIHPERYQQDKTDLVNSAT